MRVGQLAYELAEEVKDYTLNRGQIEQLVHPLFTVRNLLQRAQDLADLDSIPRMTFASDYYEASANRLSVLTAYPLSSQN